MVVIDLGIRPVARRDVGPGRRGLSWARSIRVNRGPAIRHVSREKPGDSPPPERGNLSGRGRREFSSDPRGNPITAACNFPDELGKGNAGVPAELTGTRGPV